MNHREAGGVIVVDLCGRITLGEGCEQLSQFLAEHVGKGHTKILLNLAEVTFVDSAGIGVLTKGFIVAKKKGGGIKLLNLTAKIRDLLQITNLYTIFEVFSDEQAAVSSFGEWVTGNRWEDAAVSRMLDIS